MNQFQAAPDAMVDSGLILGAVESLGIYKTTGYSILSSQGIKDIHPGQWVPMQILCNFFETIATKIGPATLFIMGRNVGSSIPLLPNNNTIEKVLVSLDTAYKSMTRGIGFGEGWKIDQMQSNSARLVFTGHFPSDFLCGLVQGLLQRVSVSTHPRVRFDENHVLLDHGSSSIALLVNW